MMHKTNKMKHIKSIFREYFCFVFILVLFLIHLLVAAYFPLTPDEAYYWLWSRSLQLGYPDHPPIVAFWIRIGTYLFGNTPFGIRFLAVCSTSLAGIFLWKASSSFFGEVSGKWAVYLFSCTIFSNVIALIITPDTPAVLFLSISLWITSYLLKLDIERKKLHFFLVLLLGFFFALSFLSKYTAILPVFGISLVFFLRKPSFLFKKETYFSVIIFLIIITPNIVWNLQHQGAALVKQGNRFWISEGHIGSHYLELFGGQIGLITPVIFFLILKVIFERVENQREKDFLIYASLPGIIFFLLYPLHARVQANWPFVLWPLLLLIGSIASKVWKVIGCLVGGVFVGLVYLQSIFHILPLNPHYDLGLRQLEGWADLAKELEKTLGSGVVLETDDYALGAILAYALKDSSLRVGTTDVKIQLLEKSKVATLKGRSIEEVRNDFNEAKEGFICRYNYAEKIRCYALGKEQTKKISLFSKSK